MANLNLQNQQNNLTFGGQARKPLKFFLTGTSVQIANSRNYSQQMTFFDNGNPTLFPANGSGQYNSSATTPTLVNFQTGAITGADAYSGSFVPTIPAANQYVAASVFIKPSSALGVVYSPSNSSLSALQALVLANDSTVVGLIPTGSIRLFTVILTSTNGTTVSTLSEGNFYQFLGNYNTVPSSGSVLYNDNDTSLIEYFLSDAFAGDTTFLVYKTMLKVGDTITCDHIVASELTTEIKTVTDITTSPTFDTITFSPPFVQNFTLDGRPRAIKSVFDDANTSARAHFGNILADSGWIFVSSGDSGDVPLTINKHLNGIPVVYFNTTASNTAVKQIPNGFIANVNQIGVWVYGESSGFNSLTYQVGNQGVYFDFTTNTLQTAGYIRVILKKM